MEYQAAIKDHDVEEYLKMWYIKRRHQVTENYF